MVTSSPMSPPTDRVLFLHGLASTGTAWNAVRAEAGGPNGWTAPLLPWSGRLGPQWSREPDAGRWLLEAVEQDSRTSGPADVIVAHSYAATLLLNVLAADRRRSLDGVVELREALIGRHVVLVAPFFRPQPELFDMSLMSGLVESFQRTMAEGMKLMMGERTETMLIADLAEKLCDELGPYGWLRFFEEYLRTALIDVEQLQQLDVSVDVVTGVHDTVAPPHESRWLVDRLLGARLHRLPHSGHFPMLDSPRRLAQLLCDQAKAHQLSSLVR